MKRVEKNHHQIRSMTTSPCGGTTLAFNDDFCSLQSQISTFLNAGTYYITIEGFSSTSSGAYTLNVTRENITGTPVISGATNLCGGSSAAYSVNGVTGATGYNWSVSGGTVLSGKKTKA